MIRYFGTLPQALMGMLVYAQLTDLVTFLFAANVLAIEGESNAIAVLIYQHTGPLGVVVWKGLAIGAMVFMARHKKWGNILGWFGILAGTVGYVVNVAALAVSV